MRKARPCIQLVRAYIECGELYLKRKMRLPTINPRFGIEDMFHRLWLYAISLVEDRQLS
jgi:hypothetical protein